MSTPHSTKRWIGALAGLSLCTATLGADPSDDHVPYGIVIHGGAGTITRSALGPEKEAQIRAKLTEAVNAGYSVLEKNGSSLDAVVAVIELLEDSPLFNAGIGAVYTDDARHELDASIMDGATRQAGAVASVTTVRNPIRLARAVLEQSEHVFLSGSGAEAFARSIGLPAVENDLFDTPFRRQQLERARDQADAIRPDQKFGTVGAVALDRHGNLAAGTSTGGMTRKRFGRIGDSPVIGAGTFADNESCAVSATGHGEFFIRYVVAYDICARVRYRNERLVDAADAVVLEQLRDVGGSGGVIAIDRRGNMAMPFNTEGMYRASRRVGEPPVVGIYSERAESDSQ
ncbi:MAG: isoaspartyl peptidase/L-asparaginase [Pseudomonadota bacterium]